MTKLRYEFDVMPQPCQHQSDKPKTGDSCPDCGMSGMRMAAEAAGAALAAAQGGRKPVEVLREFGRAVGVDVDASWARVKANLVKLDACPRHDFVPVDDGTPLSRRERCSKCEGTLDRIAAQWYRKGLAHGTPAGQ